MTYKILEANGVDNENVDGAAFNNFISSSQPGIIQGILNECPVYQVNSTTVGIGTGELIVSGFRIKILSDYTVQQAASVPDTEFQIVAKITLSSDRTVLFEFVCRPITALTQDPLFKTERGVYEAEIAQFTMGSSGLKSYKRTMPVISVRDAVSKYAEQAILSVQQTAEASIKAAENQVNSAAERVEEAYASIQGLEAQVSKNDKRIINLEKGLPASSWETDSGTAYIKNVPENALPYAAISKIGGMSRKCTNLVPFPYDISSGTYNGVNVIFNDDGSFTFNGTATSASYLLLKSATLPTGTYYVSDSGNNDWKGRFYVSLPTENYFKDSSFTLTEPTDVSFRIAIYGSFSGTATFYPMVNTGTTALPFEPYFTGIHDAKVTEVKSVKDSNEHTLAIPESVQSLEGYGLGVDNTYYNYIDFESKKFNRAVKKSVFDGSDDEVYQVGQVGSEFTIVNITMKGGYDYSPAIINYNLSYRVGYDTRDAHFYVSHSLLTLVVPNSIIPDIATFRTYVINNPIEVVFETETHTTEDIPEIDNLIGVEGGGTLTFENEYGYDVPSEVIYQLNNN